jgi:hypothetical protein
MTIFVAVLPIIQLRPDRAQAFTRNPVRRAADAADQALAPKLLENSQRTIVQTPAIAVDAIDLDDATARIKAVENGAALRQRVEHALFIF